MPEHSVSTGVARHHTTNCREPAEGILCQDHTPRGSDGHIRRKSLHMSGMLQSLDRTKKPIAPHSGNHVGTMLEPFWNHAGTMLESCWNPVGTMLEPCWNHAGAMLEPCWNHVGTTLEPCWNQVAVSKKLPTPSSDKLDAAKFNTEMLGAINWPHCPW